jgi:hypothetical protein
MLIKSKIMDVSNCNTDAFITLRDQFFQDEVTYQQLLNQASDKNLKTLITFVYNVVNYVLSKRTKDDDEG